MSKNHLKRLAAPRTWNINRKSSKLIVRPYGYLEYALPIAIILKELLKLTKSRLETKRVVNSKKVLLDGKTARNDKLPAGIMSVVEVKGIDSFRVLLNANGKIFLKKLDSKESSIKLCKIVSKTTLKGGKLQLGFHDGRTIIAENKNVSINDTVVFKLPEFKIEKYLKLAKNASVYLIGGSNIGSVGEVEKVSDSVVVKVKGIVVKTGKEKVFVIGEGSPIIKVD
ncbi:hypothetical protein J4470_05260 [Candidatus Woesearchaeota archaeon]|nr:hypothetical protein [Candidatus Woesearchaeota archaeon]